MYLDFYGLKSEPFSVTPDPEFLFLSKRHKEALGSIIYGVDKRLGFVAILGEVGTGKTTILRSFLTTIDRATVKPIYIFCPNVPFAELIKTVIRELSSEPKSEDSDALVQQLLSLLIIEYQKGINVVLIIDEAQNAPVETLANLHMLSNLETTKDKLIQIILTGQPELDQKLNLYQLRQLKQRIASRATILQLTAEESSLYVAHRLLRAGASDPANIFTKPALDAIVAHANGNPRILNMICNQALIAGFANQESPLSEATVVQIIAEADGHALPQKSVANAQPAFREQAATPPPAQAQMPQHNPRTFEKSRPIVASAPLQSAPLTASIPKSWLIAVGSVIFVLLLIIIFLFSQANFSNRSTSSNAKTSPGIEVAAEVPELDFSVRPLGISTLSMTIA